MDLSNDRTSKLVKSAILARKMTLEECCKAFNEKHVKEIMAGSVKPLNKDFLSRVTRNKFKVCSSRILKLCEFLEIDDSGVAFNHLEVLTNQINEFGKQIEADAGFKARFSAIANFLNGLNLKKILGEG
ncbi:MAG: hypothetical protein OXK19_08515 [Candidatus Dadabacteria bacterium]|nr:hypothetical protein [Candidatus Dadabacteria bacterium]